MPLFRPPNPLPPSGGEGVADAAGIINHKALNRFNFIPSPPMGISANLSTIKLTFCKEKQLLVILNGAQRSEESL